MIDLHAHTHYSDGTHSPAQLLAHAEECALTALAITDHDTFAGYDEASTIHTNLDLICGIELTTRLGRSSVHILGYFPGRPPSQHFRDHLQLIADQRKDRNRRLIQKLQSLGIRIELEEVEAVGRYMTARPHFAQVLVRKGYVESYDDAFARYLSEEGSAFVVREAPPVPEGIRSIREAGGVASLAHPIRLKMDSTEEDRFIGRCVDAGMQALEVFHSDHSPAAAARYLQLAERYKLVITGGSDFHGSIKPKVKLGSQRVSRDILTSLRAAQAKPPLPVETQ
ncbi:MAG: PHP domain-containing protein [Acidobacteria bacterium]|nr:PHP domain-containing protein [Acidobacteriota bacterium]